MSAGGGAVVVLPLWRALPMCAPWCSALRPLPLCPSFSWPFGGSLPPCCVAPDALSLWAPACSLGPLLAPLPRALPLPFPFPVWWWWGGAGAYGAPMAHAWGWLVGATGGGFRGSGGAEALDRVPKEGFPCLSSKVCTMCTPSCLPAPPAHFTQQRSSRRAGVDHQARWAAAWGGESSELVVLERRWRGLRMEDAYGLRGKGKA